MKKITILVPAYNEEESLPFLYERVSATDNRGTKDSRNSARDF